VELEVHLAHEDGADSPTESAHPKHDPRLVASDQGKVCMVKERLQLQPFERPSAPQGGSAVVSPQSGAKAQDKPTVRSPRLAAGEKKKAQAKSTSKQSTGLSPQSSVQEKQGDILSNAVSQAADTAAKKTGDDLGNAVGRALGL